ncbi:DUF4394 domain-containing protein [Niveispirillum sp.]|uniref:DUF4394 domain-containing protein n=1 Tax=Niveispirillum sp. TaxID=1917217 RepID=UPI001B68ACF1|nr:DUF4394 domain-containing protein [Niveispirillum sp.]MBP7337201.1 DUF4394 domain-containing protein [Niveispirillum sp.]
MNGRKGLVACATLAVLAGMAVPAGALEIAGLNQRNELLLFSDTAPGKVKTVPVTGVKGKLLGVDVRPANGKLYGLATDNSLYAIDLETGAATAGPKLSVALTAIDHVVVDFNPQADRLRIMGSDGQNLRVNVETGQAAVDKPLAYHPNDKVNAGKRPAVYAGAYINSFAGATQTQLFDADSGTGAWLSQDPPNDGVLRTIGPLGVPAGTIVEGVDIFTDSQDEYHGRAVAGGTLYSLDVQRGTMKKMGRIGDGGTVIDIAILDKR